MKNAENRWVDLSNGVAWSIIFSLAAIIMGVIALSTSYPRTDLSLDYMGVIVGILTLLVTALIGWQVYQAISFEHRIKVITDSIELKSQKAEARIYFTQGLMTMLLADETDGKKTQYGFAYKCFLEVIKIHLKYLNDSQIIDSSLSNMRGCLNAIPKEEAGFDVSIYVQCDLLYKSIRPHINKLDNEMQDKIRKLHEDRSNIKTCDLSKEGSLNIVTIDAESDMAQYLFRMAREARLERIAASSVSKEPAALGDGKADAKES